MLPLGALFKDMFAKLSSRNLAVLTEGTDGAAGRRLCFVLARILGVLHDLASPVVFDSLESFEQRRNTRITVTLGGRSRSTRRALATM